MTSPDKQDFFSAYLTYTRGNEIPPIFHRWSAIAGLAAFIGRDAYFQFGDAKIIPNQYIMLVGVPGTKKTSAIKRIKKLLTLAGYDKFSAEKTSKEKFLMDLAGVTETGNGKHDSINSTADFLDLSFTDDSVKEVFIPAEEFNDFFGNNILDFIGTLGVLWDKEGVYESRVKNSLSVRIPNPTINLLGGNTQETFANTFPPQANGQGFLSRLLTIYARPTGRKITIPRIPSQEETDELITFLHKIKTTFIGRIELTDAGYALLDKQYKTWEGLQDIRFVYYNNRRFTHLLKLCMLHAAARLSNVIDCEDIVYANTVLTHAEHFMPKAYGAFGQATNSSLSYKLLLLIEESTEPKTPVELWKLIQGEAKDFSEMAMVLQALAQADKIQNVDGKVLAKKKILVEQFTDLIDYSYLSDEERSFI